MRQAGTLHKQSDAERFADYLVTRGIRAHTEMDSDGWAIWVRDEDALEQAKGELEQFRVDPTAARYQGVERQAESLRQDELRRRERAKQNVVVMGQRWRQGLGRRAPLVFLMIGLCVLVFILTGLPGIGGREPSQIMRKLEFCQASELEDAQAGAKVRSPAVVTVNIRRGEVWRLVSPIFVHLSVMHIAFNLYMFHYLGAQIEDRRGSLRFGLLVLVVAVVSNFMQAWLEYPLFGGMSGVNYGLFGYVWMKTRFEASSGLYVSQLNIVLLIGWFFACLFGFIGDVANTAHGAGLFVGVAIGYAPLLIRPPRE